MTFAGYGWVSEAMRCCERVIAAWPDIAEAVELRVALQADQRPFS